MRDRFLIILVYSAIIMVLLNQTTGHNIKLILVGVAGWSLLEYVMHRFILHLKTYNKGIEKFIYYLHGYHHNKPNVVDFLPLTFTLPIAMVLALTVIFIIGADGISIIVGLLLGYLTYDILHYVLHHYNCFKTLKRHHFDHHFKNHYKNFGVTSPFWDYVFCTKRKSLR